MGYRVGGQIEFLLAGLRDPATGTTLGGAQLVACEPFLVDDNNVPLRKTVWTRASRAVNVDDFAESVINVDANGQQLAYADGNYTFHVYKSGNPPPAPGQPLSGADFKIENYHYAQETLVNAADFGAFPIGTFGDLTNSKDQSDALQAAIDFCTADPTKPRTLYIPPGDYRIDKPLKILQKYITGRTFQYTYVTLHMYGELRSVNDHCTRIWTAYCDRPALIIQNGYGVTIRHMTFAGQNRFDQTWFYQAGSDFGWLAADDQHFVSTFTTPSPIPGHPPNIAFCRDNVHSPHAGIVIDPFNARSDHSMVPVGDQYPNLSKASPPEEFYLGAVHPGSSCITIEGCEFLNFVVGLMISPAGGNHNAEQTVIRDCNFVYNKVGIAIGQSQARLTVIENANNYGSLFFVDTRSYGRNISVAPYIRGATCGATKYMFNIDVTSQTVHFEQIYCENLLSLGYIGAQFTSGQEPAHFTGCTFNMRSTRPYVDFHLYNHAPLRFTDCSIELNNYDDKNVRAPFVVFNTAPIQFKNCRLLTLDYNPNDPTYHAPHNRNGSIAMGFAQPELVTFEATKIFDITQASGASYLESVYRTPGLAQRCAMPAGAMIGNAHTGSAYDMRLVSASMKEVAILPAVKITQGAQTAAFTPNTPGTVHVGDVVYLASASYQPEVYHAPPAVSADSGPAGAPEINPQALASDPSTSGPVGIISRKDPVFNIFTIDFIPNRLPSGDYVLKVKRYGRYHAATVGDTTAASNVITNVQVNGSLLTAGQLHWAVGDRIMGGGFSSGTYILSITLASMVATFTVSTSTSALGTGTGMGRRLYDADVAVFSGSPE